MERWKAPWRTSPGALSHKDGRLTVTRSGEKDWEWFEGAASTLGHDVFGQVDNGVAGSSVMVASSGARGDRYFTPRYRCSIRAMQSLLFEPVS